MKTPTISLIKSLIIAIIVLAGFQSAFGDFSPPAGPPPGNNTAARPFYTEGIIGHETTQEKAGGLAVRGEFLAGQDVAFSMDGSQTSHAVYLGPANYANALFKVFGQLNAIGGGRIQNGLTVGDSDTLPQGLFGGVPLNGGAQVDGTVRVNNTITTDTLAHVGDNNTTQICATQDGQIVLCEVPQEEVVIPFTDASIGLYFPEDLDPGYTCTYQGWRFQAQPEGGSGSYSYLWELCPIGLTAPGAGAPPAAGTECQAVSTQSAFEHIFYRRITGIGTSQPYSVEVKLRMRDIQQNVVHEVSRMVNVTEVPESAPSPSGSQFGYVQCP